MDARGQELQPLDEEAVRRLAGELDACGAEAVAICLMHAYANPAHELPAARSSAGGNARSGDLAVARGQPRGA